MQNTRPLPPPTALDISNKRVKDPEYQTLFSGCVNRDAVTGARILLRGVCLGNHIVQWM